MEADLRAWLLLICLAGVGCRARHDERAAPSAASAVSAPLPSSTALAPRPSASATVGGASGSDQAAVPPGVPFAVTPMVQVKHRTDGQRVFLITAEPGILLGPKKTLLKAFDCVSKGAPHADMFGICVGFKACDAETPTETNVLAAFACTGPALRILLVQEGPELVFKVADPTQPLAKRALSRTPLPEGASVSLQPFVRRNLTSYVDL
jgi:hypothetical protein